MTSKILYKRLGKKIREFRKAKGLTIEKLAEKANLNECFLGELERGRKKPSLDTLFKLAKVLGVDIYLLFDFHS